MSTTDVIERGLKCLSEHMGPLDTEIFISTLIREQFDYTKWHRRFADSVGKEDFEKLVHEAEKSRPYGGDKATVI